MEQLIAELDSLRSQRMRKEQEVASMENLALKQRFQEIVDNLTQEIMDKELEVCIIDFVLCIIWLKFKHSVAINIYFIFQYQDLQSLQQND